MKNVLLLGSQSHSRQQLLKNAQIPFKTIGHSADETKSDWEQLSFSELLKNIALEKMKHVLMTTGKEGEIGYVLTADTMGKDSNGVIHGKPTDKEDAIIKIKALRGHGICGTSFCLEKKIWQNGGWQLSERIIDYVQATYEFDMPDAWIEKYLTAVPHYLQISGSLTIEGFGAQFLKRIDGSYTTIIGLPMFQVREALEKLDFFN